MTCFNVSLSKWMVACIVWLSPFKIQKSPVFWTGNGSGQFSRSNFVFKGSVCLDLFNCLSTPAKIPQAMRRMTATFSLPRDPVFPESMAKFLPDTGHWVCAVLKHLQAEPNLFHPLLETWRTMQFTELRRLFTENVITTSLADPTKCSCS